MSLRRNVSAFLGAVFLCIGLITPLANAQEQGGSGLQLSPTRTEMSANIGEQKTFSLTLKNITKADFTAEATLNDFQSDGVTGTPKFLVDSNERTPYSLSKMIKGIQNVDIKAGETKEVKLTVDVPGNAAPGAYFGAVRFSVAPKGASDTERTIALNASVAHLVFVEVPGDVVQQIKVESLKVQKGQKSGKFFFNKPDKAALGVKNLGNGFSRPFGKVSINAPGGKTAYSYELNSRDPQAIVLPNSSRTFTDDIKNIKTPGKYTFVAAVAYGNGGEVISYKSSFWYMPVWFIIVILLAIALIAGVVYLVYRKRFSSSSNRHKNPKTKS